MLRSIISVAVIATLSTSIFLQPVDAGSRKLKDFAEAFGLADRLESLPSQILGTDLASEQQKKRLDLMEDFIRESKIAHCTNIFNRLNEVIEEYSRKALEFINDDNTSKNWFSSVASMMAGPLNSMRNLSKFSVKLREITTRYEEQSKKRGLLKQVDIECDMHKFRIRMLDRILFVLKSELKYLVTEPPEMLNKVIYEQLKQEKFVSDNNFPTIHQLTSVQSELLRGFYLDQVKQNHSITIGEATEHFERPSSHIIGRLLEDCNEVPQYVESWELAEAGRAKVCPNSLSDPANDRFPKEFQVTKYSELANFCSKFSNSL